MPIVDILLIGSAPADATLSGDLAQAIGRALGAAAGTVWVTLSRRPAADYAENGPLTEPLPVFVRVLASGEVAPVRAAPAIAGAVAEALARPVDRVHVIFEPAANGRVYLGGYPSQG